MPRREDIPPGGVESRVQDSPGSFAQCFARIKKALGITSQKELAQALGVQQSSVSDAKHRGVIPGEWAIKLFRSHGVNPGWIYDGLPPMRIGRDGDGLPGGGGNNGSFLLKYSREALRAMRMPDASMAPLIPRDSFVGVNRQDRIPIHGGLYGVMLPLEGFSVRRLEPDAGGDQVAFLANNPLVDEQRLPMDQAMSRIVGRVVWVMART